MKKIWKQIMILTFTLMIVCSVKISSSAATPMMTDIIWNTEGDTLPDINGNPVPYLYKYYTGGHYQYKYAENGESYAEWIKSHPMVNITYQVEYRYDMVEEMAALVNQERAKAGVAPLTLTDDMTEIAMQRAAETALYWYHTRPNGQRCSTLSCLIDGENIHAGSSNAKDANESFVDSPPHYEAMVNSDKKYAGYGCVTIYRTDGSILCTYWVQNFCTGRDNRYPDGSAYDYGSYTKKGKYKATITTPILAEYILKLVIVDDDMWIGESRKADTPYTYTFYGQVPALIPLSTDQYKFESLNDCLTVKNGVITAVKAGTGKLKYTLKADPSKYGIQEIRVKTSKTVSGSTYKVTSVKDKTAALTQGRKQASSIYDTLTITIPSTVKIGGQSYKVTAIAANAFKGNKNVAKVTIGANVKTIGKQAFYGCKKLKKITVKSAKIKSVGKNALKGIHKKAVVKVPKSKLSKYKRLFKNKGQKKTVKIKK